MEDEFGFVEPYFVKMTAGQREKTIEHSSQKQLSPMVKPHFSEKARKAFIFGTLVGSASFVLLFPLLAEASFFSLGGLISTASAQKTDIDTGSSYNSQNLPLPKPAVNTDPSSTPKGSLALVAGSALMPETGPSGTEADIEEHPASSQISVYTVHKGDSLQSIARMFNVSVNTIVWANDIKGGTIHEGDVLVILPITGIRHTVLKGETLASLAKTYKSNAHDIANFNDLADSAKLAVGDSVIIPDGELGGTSSTGVVVKSHKKPTMLQLARAGKQTAPLRGANGPDLGNYFMWPVDGGEVTQGLHGFDAVDIGAQKGTAIFAAAAGTVLIARQGGWNGGYGSYVVIAHENGAQTLYAHMSRVLVSSGDSVEQGDTIGKVGATGEATGAHLHFEVRGAKNPFGDLAVGGSE